MIDKWLKAGVLDKGILRRTTGGTPQGGVISPLLANIYLHYVLDEWFEQMARPRLKGRCQLVRYADDAVIAFEDHLSGKRLLDVLGKRLNRYGLQLHPAKTRFVDFRFKRPNGRHPATVGTTFNFLGFTHVWGLSRQGKNVVRQITAKDRYACALASVMEWCRLNLHRPFREQHAYLSRVIRGHCAYYGITGNGRRIRWYHHQVARTWKKWLARRGRHSNLPWSRSEPCSRDTRCRQPRSSTNMPLRERSLRVKNRMRVIRSSGSVRGGGGDIPTHSASCEPDGAAVGEALEAGIAVDLNDTFELRQMGGRTLGLAIGTVEIDRGRRIGSIPGAVIAGVDPEPAGLGAAAAGIQHPGSGCRRRTASERQRHARRVWLEGAPTTSTHHRPSWPASNGPAGRPAGRRSGSVDKAGGGRNTWRPAREPREQGSQGPWRSAVLA
jgi:Reverse transcriptase (RNA-dependent DNA polymerase)